MKKQIISFLGRDQFTKQGVTIYEYIYKDIEVGDGDTTIPHELPEDKWCHVIDHGGQIFINGNIYSIFFPQNFCKLFIENDHIVIQNLTSLEYKVNLYIRIQETN